MPESPDQQSSSSESPLAAEYCQFGKRELEKFSWIAPLVNNRIGDALNMEMRHQQLFYVRGNGILKDVGFSEKGKRFSEADFGKPIHNLEDMKRNGYWFVGKRFDPAVMEEALDRQKDGYYYSFFSNQCQDWADRLDRTARKVEREWKAAGKAIKDTAMLNPGGKLPPEKPVPPTEPASLAMGIVAVLLGIAAVVTPFIAGRTYAYILGAYFVAAGVFQAIYAFHGTNIRAIVPILFLSLISTILGLTFVFNTAFAVVSVSLLLAIVLGLQGLSSLFLGFTSRPRKNWVGTIIAGFGMVALAAVLIARWPDNGPRLMGFFVGLSFLLGGLSTLFYSYKTRTDPE